MIVTTTIIGLLIVLNLGLAWQWVHQLGIMRGLAAAFCRSMSLLPLVFCLFPQLTSEPLPPALIQQPIHILLDDSLSMTRWQQWQSPYQQAQAYIASLEKACQRLACTIKLQRLSELEPITHKGYTPLSRALPPWLENTASDPWILMTDGGDFQPSLPWHEAISQAALFTSSPAAASLKQPSSSLTSKHRGVIVAFSQTEAKNNIWLDHVDIPPFAFEGQQVQSEVRLRRTQDLTSEERVQVQVSLGEQVLASENALFAAGQAESQLLLAIPPLLRGRHLITLKALAGSREESLWDNQTSASIEVMPNTLGVLHLLGSPSWDGRFLRRFLKAEPKYDLISFFILRDPWDSQIADERELSLIPFPVDRLFNEELPNFRVVIIQNFNLTQFLMPEYQENLVTFVKQGGGLLYIGGHRALLDADLAHSPLKSILPFSWKSEASSSQPLMALWETGEAEQGPNPSAPWFEENLAFTVELAKPAMEKRALANVYDDWEVLAPHLSQWQEARGLHHMENVEWQADAYTPLLLAKTADGRQRPLAIASYPGKGRALWLFTDSLWSLALTPKAETSREVYDQFWQSAMTWLMRQDLRKPLSIVRFHLERHKEKVVGWQASLQGPVIPYFPATTAGWHLNVCGQKLSPEQVHLNRLGNQLLQLSGQLLINLKGGEECVLRLEGEHPAFGSVSATASSMLANQYKDQQLAPSPAKLQKLASLSSAPLIEAGSQTDEQLISWLKRISSQEGIALPQRFRSFQDHYWFLQSPWLWLCLLFLPLEVLLRRWHQLRPR